MRRSTYRDTVKAAAATGSAGAQEMHAYDAIAAAMSRDLEKFSLDIATIASLRRA